MWISRLMVVNREAKEEIPRDELKKSHVLKKFPLNMHVFMPNSDLLTYSSYQSQVDCYVLA